MRLKSGLTGFRVVHLVLCPQMERIMEKAGNRHLLQVITYPGAGHLIEPPYTPHHRVSNFLVFQSQEKGMHLELGSFYNDQYHHNFYMCHHTMQIF